MNLKTHKFPVTNEGGKKEIKEIKLIVMNKGEKHE
jgi:hypothetical protein